jgi:hypothetical protein
VLVIIVIRGKMIGGDRTTLTRTGPMGGYRIVEWWPDQPDKKELAMLSTFHDLALAETIEKELKKGMPERLVVGSGEPATSGRPVK